MSVTKKISASANQFGDTIIEVIVVLAVLGLAISISYATASRSLLNARQAQENSIASGLVETQVENLRLLVHNSTPANNNANTNIFIRSRYCIKDSLNPTKPIIVPGTGSVNCTFESVPYTVLIYNCNKTAAGPCASAGGPDVFAVRATWPDVLSEGTDSVTVDYRLHAP